MNKSNRCEFYGICPDIMELKSYRDGKSMDSRFEDLAEQEMELCLGGGYGCSIRKSFLEKKRERNQLLSEYSLRGGILEE